MLQRKLIFKYDDGILMYLRNLSYYFLIIIYLLYYLTVINILIYYNIITLKKKIFKVMNYKIQVLLKIKFNLNFFFLLLSYNI